MFFMRQCIGTLLINCPVSSMWNRVPLSIVVVSIEASCTGHKASESVPSTQCSITILCRHRCEHVQITMGKGMQVACRLHHAQILCLVSNRKKSFILSKICRTSICMNDV